MKPGKCAASCYLPISNDYHMSIVAFQHPEAPYSHKTVRQSPGPICIGKRRWTCTRVLKIIHAWRILAHANLTYVFCKCDDLLIVFPIWFSITGIFVPGCASFLVIALFIRFVITQTCPCNILQYFTAVKMIISR